MNKTIILGIVLILCLSGVYASNYLENSGFSDGTISKTISQDGKLYLYLPSNVTVYNMSWDMLGYISGGSALNKGLNINYTYATVKKFTGDWHATTYNYSFVDDNDWATYSTCVLGDPKIAYGYLNYSINTGLNRVYELTSKITNDASALINSTSICDTSGSKLKIKVTSYLNSTTTYGAGVLVHCWNGSKWAVLRNSSCKAADCTLTAVANRRIYGVKLVAKTYPENLTVTVNNKQIYKYNSAITNKTATGINVTPIITYLATNRTIPLYFDNVLWSNMTVSDMSLFFQDMWECNSTNGGVPAINFTIEDEDNFTTLKGDISVDLTYLNNILSFEKQNVSSLAICIGGSNNYTVSGTVTAETAYTHKYFLRSAVFTPNTQHINLYNFKYTAGLANLIWTVRDNTYSVYPNVIGKLLRYYPTDHAWLTVQQDISDDFGRLIYQIREVNTDYKLEFYSGTSLLASTNSMKFICDEFDVCQVSYQVTTAEGVEKELNPSWTFSNITKILTINWNDATGATSYVHVRVYQPGGFADTVICNASIYSASGSYACNTSGYFGEATVSIRAAASPLDLIEVFLVKLTADYKSLSILIGKQDSAFWAFAISLMTMLVGIASPVGAFVMMFIGIMITSMLGISAYVSTGFLGIAAIIGIIISYGMKK